MSAKYTPGARPVRTQGRPRRWGIPTAAQFNLLADCIEAGSTTSTHRYAHGTINACRDRQWIETVITHTDTFAKITEQGRAVVRSNSQ